MDNVGLSFSLFIVETLRFVGGVGLLTRDVLRELRGKFYWKLLGEQIYQVGLRSLPLILITLFSMGMVMSLQFGLGLEKFGGKLYVPKLLAVTILREIGPVFTSLMLAARVGAGIASEIGSMVVTQQIDAIRALGTSPIKKIVIPRVLACLIVLPILVSIANVVGNIGGMIIGVSELKLDPNFYLLKVITTSSIGDYLSGFGKTFFFAFFISIPSCYFGLTVKNGTKEVGIATTKAVVVSSILILVGDFFLSKLFWIVEKTMSQNTRTGVIEVVDFHKSFDKKKVHSGVNFYVRRGECLGLIGGSGTGKSVLLRSLVGLEKPDSGQILIDGVDIAPMRETELVEVRKKVAYVFQGGALFDSMTVYENLAYPLREHFKYTEKEVAQKIREQLTEFGLPESEKLYPGNLSGGMQKRVGLARAMMMHPEVVLYDEPTAGLDPYNTKKIQESILSLKAKGVTSILVTHDMPTVYAVCDKVALLLNGRIGEQYTIDKLKQEPSGPMSQFINGESA